MILEATNSTKKSPTASFAEDKLFHLLIVQNDPEFKISGRMARMGGAKAEYTNLGWFYETKEDALKVAEHWQNDRRKLKVFSLVSQEAEILFGDDKEKARLMRREIKLYSDEIQKHKKYKELEGECYSRHGFYAGWLEADIDQIPEEFHSHYKYYKPKMDEILQEIVEIKRKNEDLRKERLLKEKDESVRIPPGEHVTIGGAQKVITTIESLNERFAQLEAPRQACIYIHKSDAMPITTQDLKMRLSGQVIEIEEEKKPTVYKDAFKFWVGDSRKVIYKKIEFTSKPVGKDVYNLFYGFGVEAEEGDCSRILQHIGEVICSGNKIVTEAFIKLLAWQIQNIGKPSRVITALKSKQQQTGKGFLLDAILAPIYGNAGFTTKDINQITSRFNDSMRGRAYVFLDEALFSGDRRAADSIKSASTASTMAIETKGMPISPFPVGINFFLTTNHDDAAFIEEHDARYWIIEVSSHRFGDHEYFAKLLYEVENGGREAFLYHLLNVDVSDFIPSVHVPKNNEAKSAMIQSSINPYDARKWLEQCCEAEMLIGYKPTDYNSQFPWQPWIVGDEYVNGIYQTAYAEWQKTVKSPVAPRPTHSTPLGMLLERLGFTLRIHGPRRRSLPCPQECLKKIYEKK
jgi:hypothetical protein